MTIPIVLPYAPIPHPEELRYALRGLDTFLGRWVDDLYIVGGPFPDWLTGCKQIPMQQGGDRWRNTSNALLEAAEAIGSGPALYTNDDFHAVSGTAAAVLEGTWNRGLIKDRYKVNRRATMHRKGAIAALKLIGDEALDYELHIPMVIDLEGMAETIMLMRREKTNEAYKRSVYANLWGSDDTYGYRDDVKVKDVPDGWLGDWLSTSNGNWGRTKASLLVIERLPEPSRWES